MNLSCHECYTMAKPFYNICLVIGSRPGRVAFSQTEFDLCKSNYAFVSSKLKKSLDQLKIPVGFMLGSETEETAILKSRMEAPLAVYDRFGPYSFLEKEDAIRDLSKTAGDLLAKIEWVEKVGNEWKKAEWAHNLYEWLNKL